MFGALRDVRERLDSVLTRNGIDHAIYEYGAAKQIVLNNDVTIVIRAREENIVPAGIGFKMFEREGTIDVIVYVRRELPGATNESIEECGEKLDNIIGLIMRDFSEDSTVGKYVITRISRLSPAYAEFGYCVAVVGLSLKRFDAIH